MQVDVSLVEQIVKQVLAQRAEQPQRPAQVPIGVSGRHLHLTRQDMDTLFGPGSQLTPVKDLMGGQFAAQETVTLIGPSLRPIEKVRVLGPLRKATQVEILRTDTFVLKLKTPVRASGDIKGSAPITIAGPKGVITIPEGCIIANRHIHMTPEDAAFYGVRDGEFVECMCEGERRTLLYDVQIRVDPGFTLEMHIDNDDANAIGFLGKSQAKIIKAGSPR